MSAIITLTTDFGTVDSYVAQMKGQILKIASEAQIVDVTHEIPPQDIRRAAIVLREIVPSFPKGTIHLAVVDPGVGSHRRAIAAEMAEQRFVGPDNGLFGLVARDWPLQRIVELDRAEAWKSSKYPPSSTFHGRDIFAPVAARWSLGAEIQQLGTLIREPLRELDWRQPQLVGNQIIGEVISIDHFGNVTSNVRGSLLNEADTGAWTFQMAGNSFGELRRFYGEAAINEPLALIGSSGFLELAVRQGSAAELFGIKVGDAVICQRH